MFRTKIQKMWLGIVGASLLLVLKFAFFNESNASARAQITSTLLSSAAPQQQLAKLAPFVKPGDPIAEVHRRIAPRPNEELRIQHPTEHSYGLDGANLVLATDEKGIVIGIGKHVHDRDDGTVWLIPPNWRGS